jgi:hypothetical protein
VVSVRAGKRFQLSDDERSTRLTSVLRSEAFEYNHVRMTQVLDFSKLIQCTKTKTYGDIPDQVGR